MPELGLGNERLRRLLLAQGVLDAPTTPTPPPPVSDELAGSPAYQDQRQVEDESLRNLLRAQGASVRDPVTQVQDTPTRRIPPISDELEGAPRPSFEREDSGLQRLLDIQQGRVPGSPQSSEMTPAPPVGAVTSGPITSPSDDPIGEIEIDGSEEVSPPARVLTQQQRSVLERVSRDQTVSQQTRDRAKAALSGEPIPPRVQANELGDEEEVYDASDTPVDPTASRHGPIEMQLRNTLTDDERRQLEAKVNDPKEDPDLRANAQMQLDLDESKWNVPKGDPGEDFRPRTGDPARDARIKAFNEEYDRVAQVEHSRPYDEKIVLPDRIMSDEERARLGYDGEDPDSPITKEAIEVVGNRPDPYGIDARARRYTSQADDFADGLGKIGPNGEHVPPTEEDIAYSQANMLDKGYQDSIESLSRQRALEEVRLKRELPAREEYDEVSKMISKQRIEALAEFSRLHRQHWESARKAQQEADRRYPNPDQLLGGKGSWTRAAALAIAAVGNGIGMSGTAALVNNQLRLEYMAQQAKYNREAARIEGSTNAAIESLKSMEAEDASLVGRQAAAKARLADQFDLIAAQTGDQAIQAKYQGLAGQLRREIAKDLGAFATQTANRDLKNAQLEERRRQFDLKMAGKGIPMGSGISGTVADLESLPKEMRERAIPAIDGGWFITSSKAVAEKNIDRFIKGKEVRGLIDDTLTQANNLPGFWSTAWTKASGRLSVEEARLVSSMAQIILVAKDYFGLGVLNDGDMKIMAQAMVDPEAIKNLSISKDVLKAKLLQARQGIENGLRSNQRDLQTRPNAVGRFPGAPSEPPKLPYTDYLDRIGQVPDFKALTASSPKGVKGNEVVNIVGNVNSAIEAAKRDGIPYNQIVRNIEETAANLMGVNARTVGELEGLKKKGQQFIALGKPVPATISNAIDSLEQLDKAQRDGIGFMKKIASVSKDDKLWKEFSGERKRVEKRRDVKGGGNSP